MNLSRVVFASWAAIGLSLAILMACFNSLPESIPVFVTPMGTPTMLAPTSVLMVTRIALMGAGQLGAVTVLGQASSESGHRGWTNFFGLLAAAIGAKTLLESVTLAGTGTAWGEMTSPLLNAAIIAIVVAFLLSAGLMWHRGLLKNVPAVPSRGARATIVFSVAVWFAFATIPYWW